MKFINPDEKAQKTYYLAGKMRDIPHFNMPRFFYVAARLREAGHRIINPAELDGPELLQKSMMSADGNQSLVKGQYAEIMGRDFEAILQADVDGVVLMPGWEESPGARCEAAVAFIQGKEVRQLILDKDGEPEGFAPLDPYTLKDNIFG